MSASSTVPSTRTSRRVVPLPDAATTAGAVLGIACTFVGQFVQTPWDADGRWGFAFADGGGWGGLAALVGIVVVAALLVGLATARARALTDAGRTARRALVLAVLGAVSIAVFWTGIPSVLAGGAAGLALDARRRLGWMTATAGVALGLAALTVASAVYLAVAG